jgi:hypothetical protein
MRVTPTALLGSWVLQPIKDMMSLGTYFKMHAKWQGYVEVPTAEDFIARKVHTIALNKVQGPHWNGIKCQECLGNHPEAVVRQATMNLNSQVWKSFEDSLPKLYCINLGEAFVMQESVSSRTYCEKIGTFCIHPMGIHMRNLWQNAEWGKKTGAKSSTKFLQVSCFKKMCDVCHKYGGACTTYYLGVPKLWENGTRNQIPMQPRKAQRN